MAKRLQVKLQDSQYREIMRVAKSREMSLSEWVRQALRAACRDEPSFGNVGRKLAAVRAAVKHEFPAGDIDQMLAEIASGYEPGNGLQVDP